MYNLTHLLHLLMQKVQLAVSTPDMAETCSKTPYQVITSIDRQGEKSWEEMDEIIKSHKKKKEIENEIKTRNEENKTQ